MIIEFDGTYQGLLSLIHACYYQRLAPTHIQTPATAQLTLMGEPIMIETCPQKAHRVLTAINQKISPEVAGKVYYAFLSEGGYLAILQYVQLGFKVGHMVDSHLQTPCVQIVHDLAKKVGGEAHLLLGFTRFAEMENGVFYSPITPKYNALPLVAQHFATRFINMPWVVHDKLRHQAAIYNMQEYIITPVPKDIALNYAQGEIEMQEMWRSFLKALTIEARKNPKLQRQLLPLHFRKNMTEFK